MSRSPAPPGSFDVPHRSPHAREALYRPTHTRDLLRWPFLGRFLRWRWGRLTLQCMMLALSALILYDGFTGDALAARNLATVALWVHFRGLAVLGLLLVGNVFCMACPFTLPRSLARGHGMGRLRWPDALRGRWVAISSLFLLFFLYEWLDLWRSPWLTAWVGVAYFVAAFASEALFRGSPFCRYLCPLGAFNFVYSTVSPLHVRARDLDRCKTCVGKECVNGSSSVAGCGTSLFVPQMSSNLDCIQCLDCVRACPHDNVGLMIDLPLGELQGGGWPHKLGPGFLAISLSFMGMSNAFGMTPPIYAWLEGLSGWLERLSPVLKGRTDFLPLLIVLAGLSLLLPACLAGTSAWLTRKLTREPIALGTLIGRFGPAFVPLGLAIWLVHYQFHFLTGALGIIPVTHFFMLDHGLVGGTPDFTLAELLTPSQVKPLEVLGVAIGFLASFAVLWSIGLRHYATRQRALLGVLPWLMVLIALAATAVRIFGYPMEMRGMSGG